MTDLAAAIYVLIVIATAPVQGPTEPIYFNTLEACIEARDWLRSDYVRAECFSEG